MTVTAKKPAYCSSAVYKVGSFVSNGANALGYFGGAFDVAAAGSFVGSGGVATPGSAALASVGVSIGAVAGGVGVVGNALKGMAGDPQGFVSSVIDGLAAGIPLGSPGAKEEFAGSVAGFLGGQANNAFQKSPC